MSLLAGKWNLLHYDNTSINENTTLYMPTIRFLKIEMYLLHKSRVFTFFRTYKVFKNLRIHEKASVFI